MAERLRRHGHEVETYARTNPERTANSLVDTSGILKRISGGLVDTSNVLTTVLGL